MANRSDPDKMSFLEHLEELRDRLLRMVIALFVGFAVCWSFHEDIFHFMVGPLRAAYPGVKLVATSPTEALMLFMKMSFFAGIFLAAPFVLYQIWAFVSPGLYPNEKTYVVPFILFGTLFFVLGAAFGHYWLFPLTFRFLGEFGGQDVQYLPKISEYYSFYSWFLLGLGVVFQLPVVIFVLARIGLVSAGFLLRHFRLAILFCFVAAALITPTPDVVTQTLLALPMLGLYLLGVLVAWVFGKPRRKSESSAAPVRGGTAE